MTCNSDIGTKCLFKQFNFETWLEQTTGLLGNLISVELAGIVGSLTSSRAFWRHYGWRRWDSLPVRNSGRRGTGGRRQA